MHLQLHSLLLIQLRCEQLSIGLSYYASIAHKLYALKFCFGFIVLYLWTACVLFTCQ